MRIKNVFLLSLLSILMVGCANNVNISKEPFELKIVDKYHGEYEVGFPIDVENFFYYSDRSMVTTMVSYNKNGKNVNEEIPGNTFYPKTSGEYIFTCTSSIKTINKRITVVDSKPTLSIKESACFVKTGAMVFFSDIYSEITPTYTPNTAELEVYNVQYAPYTYDISSEGLTYPLVDYDFSRTGFTPKKVGLYRILVRITNGKEKVEGVINVVASRGINDGNENVYKRDDGTYASNKVIVSDSITDTFVLPASSYSEASYVVLDPLFQNGDTIGVRFKGKSIPSLGLLASPSPSGSYAISSITGYLLSFERKATNKYTLYLPMNGVTMKDGQASRDELLGVDDLENDKYYYLTASILGNAKNGTKYSHSVHWSICEIEDYGTINEHYKVLKQLDASGGWSDEYDIPNGRVVLYSSEKRDIVVQVDALPNQNDIVLYGGSKREGVNTYTFENTTVTSSKTNGNKATVNGYIGFKGDYGAGDSITFAFKGYNIPGVALFCDTISGLTGGAKGMYICPGSGDRTLNTRLTFYGPYRLDSSNPTGYISYDGYTNYQNIFWNYRVYNDTDSPFGYDNLTDFGDYLYTIKIIKATENEVIITAILRDKQHSSFYEVVAERTYYIWGYHGPISGSIIAYPGYLSMGKNTTFSSYPVNTSPLEDENYYTCRSSYEVEEDKTRVNIDKAPYPTLNITYKANNNFFKEVKDQDLNNRKIDNTPNSPSFSFMFETSTGSDYPTVIQDDNEEYFIKLNEGNTIKLISNKSTFLNMNLTYQGSLEADVGEFKDNIWTGFSDEVVFKAKETTYISIMNLKYVDYSSQLRDISYLGVKDACQVGKTIKINFTGKNMPNVCLFTDSIDGQAIGGGRGIYLCSSFLQISDNSKAGAKDNQHKIMPYAPYRWSPQFGEFDNLTHFRYNDLGLQTHNVEGFGYLGAKDDVDYEYAITTNSLSSGYANITITVTNLESQASRSFTFNLDLLSHVSLGEKVGLGSNLIFYGQGNDITFTYSVE